MESHLTVSSPPAVQKVPWRRSWFYCDKEYVFKFTSLLIFRNHRYESGSHTKCRIKRNIVSKEPRQFVVRLENCTPIHCSVPFNHLYSTHGPTWLRTSSRHRVDREYVDLNDRTWVSQEIHVKVKGITENLSFQIGWQSTRPPLKSIHPNSGTFEDQVLLLSLKSSTNHLVSVGDLPRSSDFLF